MTIAGKQALVTGGSRGIGRGIVLKLAESGVTVAVHYYRNEAAAKETLEAVRKPGAEGFLVQADVSRPDEVRRMFGEVTRRFGTLDIFVANARPELSQFYAKPFEITLAQWDHPWTGQPRDLPSVQMTCPWRGTHSSPISFPRRRRSSEKGAKS